MRCFVQARSLLSCVLFASILGTPTALSAAESGAVQVRAVSNYGDLPLSFEANQGQVDARACFISRGDGYTFFLTPNEAVLAFSSSKNKSSQGSVLHMRLAGANRNARISGVDPLPGVSNYFSGKNPAQWRTGVPTYRKVAYENIYPGINLVYYGNQRQMEYDFVVAPGANPRDIRLAIDGSSKLIIDAEGNLVLQAASGDVQLLAPKIYQDGDGQKKEIAGKWRLYGKNTAGFRLSAYDHSKALVIDPVLMYSSFLGGSQKNSLKKIAIDAEGNAYVAGFTASGDFPAAPTPLANTFGGGRSSRGAFIAKIDPTGANLLYSTYLSGNIDEEATGLAVDASGNIYVTGTTHSTDFPVRNAFQSICAVNLAGECWDAFLTKISSTGDSLVYSTYLGGSGADSAKGLAVDAKGNAYVVGTTSSADFPVSAAALQSKCGGACAQNVFIAKFDSSGEKLSYSTYLGGSVSDAAADIAIDASSNVYLTGQTISPDFPVASAFQKTCTLDVTSSANACISTAFVAKIKADGSALAYSTYLGGSLGSTASGIAVDTAGSAYVTGNTQSADFPVAKAFQKSCGMDAASAQCSVDVFLTKFNPNGKSLAYSTYLGGGARDEASSIALDGKGNVYLAGRTESTDFPTAKPLQSKLSGTSDAFVAQFDVTGNSLTFSTFHGGSSTEAGNSLALDGKGNVYITGETASTDFPTHHPFQSSCAGNCASAFVSKMSVSPLVTSPPTLVKAFGAASIPLNGSTSLTFTVTNPNASTTLTGIGFSDPFPAGLVVSTPNGLTGTCGGGTITATQGTAVVSLSGASLAGTASCTFSINVTGIATGTEVNTTGSVTSVEGGTGGTATASVDIEAPPSIAKVFNPTSIAVSATTSLTFTITNPAANPAALTGVAFTDTLPTGLTVPNASATACGGTLTLTAPTGITLSGATIAANSQCQFSVTVTGASSGNYTNTTGNVTSTNGGTGNTASANLTVATAPAITKAFGAASVPLNGSTSLTFNLSNPNSSLTLNGVAFTDSLPAGLVVATPNGLSNTCGGTATATAGSSSVSLSGSTRASSTTCSLSVNITATTGGVKNNSVTVTSTNGGTGNTSNASVSVISPPTIIKAFGAASIPLNGSTSLSFTITNNSTTVTVNGIAFTDNLPAGLVVSTPNGLTGTCGGGMITATQGASSVSLSGASLAASGSCTFSVNVTGTAAGTQNNTTSTVTSTNGGTGGTASASIKVVAPPSIAKVFNPNKIGQNANTSLTFTITNPAANTATLTGVAFTDTLPIGLTVASASATVCGGTLTTTSPTGIDLAGASIATNSQCQFSVTVTGATSGNYTNTTGNVTSTNGGTGNTATANLTVADPPSIAKAFGATNITLNASTSLTFTITNPNSGLALNGVAFTDSLPAGLVVATPNNLSTTCSGTATATAGSSSVSLSGASVAASASCTLSVNVTGTTAGIKNNSVTVSSTNGGTGNTSNATVTVGDYTLSVAVTTPVVIQGSNSMPATLTATPASGYAGTIMPASTTCTPAGFSCTFNNFTLPGTGTNGSGSSPISVSVAPATTVGNYNLTLNVTDSSNPAVSHSVPFSLAVECMFSLTTPTFTPQTTTAAASYSITVTETQGGTVCPWTAAASGNAGVTITSGSSGTDTAVSTGNPVNFQVAPNLSNAAKSGRITVSYFAAPVNPGTSVLSVTQEASAAAPDVIAGGTTNIGVTVTQTGAQAASIAFNSACGALNSTGNLDPLDNNFGITCSAPTTDLPLAAGVTIPITINVPITATANLQSRPARNPLAPFYALGFAIPSIVFLGLGASAFSSKRRTRGLMRFMGLLLVGSMIAMLVGCGGGFHALVVPKGSANNFTLTMMGTVSDGSGGTGNVTGIEIYTITVHVTPQI